MVAGIVVFGVIVFGGFQYLISFGSPVKLMIAREQIFGGIIGLIVLLSSYMILLAIDPNLLVFDVDRLEEVGADPVDYDKIKTKSNDYFEIPIGIIIENAMFGDEFIKRMETVKIAVDEAEQASENLKNLTEELKEETEKCRCGRTRCGGLPGCPGIDCPEAECNNAEIERISSEIETAIELLKEKQEQTLLTKNPLVENISQMMAASYLMSVEQEELISYNDLLAIQFYGEEIEISTFPEWENLQLKVDGKIVRDPLTFYLDKKRTEKSIYVASEYLTLSGGTIISPPEPPDGWPDPPPSNPGVIVWPTETRRITSQYGIWRCRTWDSQCAQYKNNLSACQAHGDPCWVMHIGMDINRDLTNRPIFAAADGKVIHAKWTGSYGNVVYIEHQGLPVRYTRYAHLSKINVSVGQTVTAGQVIGIAGSTGMGTGVHLHFETRDSANRHMNPLNFLP